MPWRYRRGVQAHLHPVWTSALKWGELPTPGPDRYTNGNSQAPLALLQSYINEIIITLPDTEQNFSISRLKRDGTCAETRFGLSAKRTSLFKSAGGGRQFSRLLAPEVCGISGSNGSNAGYTVFRGCVKSTGYPLHSHVSTSLPIPCVTVCHQVSTELYTTVEIRLNTT